MEAYEKIKKTCLKLGFPQNIVDLFTRDIVDYPEKYESFHSGSHTFFDDYNFKLCSLSSYAFNDEYNFYFDFVNEQDFLKKLRLTRYNNTIMDSFCAIKFDKNYNFLSLSINDGEEISNNQLPPKLNYCDVNIFFDFDINLKIQKTNVIGYDHINSVTLFKIEHEKDNMLPIDDELLLIKFIFYMYNPEIVRYVPEFYTPSAYDFASPEFQSRILLAEMLVF